MRNQSRGEVEVQAVPRQAGVEGEDGKWGYGGERECEPSLPGWSLECCLARAGMQSERSQRSEQTQWTQASWPGWPAVRD